MKFLFQLFLFSMVCIQGIAQTQQLTPLGSEDHYKNMRSNISVLRKAIKLNDGSSFIIGTKDETYTTLDVFVAKLNSNMDTLWTYIITTPDENSLDDYRNADVDQDGNLYVHSVSLLNFSMYQTDSKHYITKLNSAGNLVFQKSLEDVALENNEPANYTTTNFPNLFSHIDDNNNYVLVYSAHSPINKITFFKFLPNNTTNINHRTDLLSYNPQVDLYGYFVSFFYEKGNYYYTSGVKKSSSSNSHEYRINKLQPQGFSSLIITPYIGGNQYLLKLKRKELKSNSLGNVLYFTFDSDVVTQSYITIAVSDQLNYLGHYTDNVRLNSFHNSQILSSGDIRLFGVSKLNSSATNNELSEVIMSNSGLITKNTLDANFNGNEIIAIDNDNIAVIYDNYIDVIDNQWQTVTSFLNISINDVNLFVEDGTAYNVFGRKSEQFIPNSTSFLDNVSTVAYKLTNSSLTYQNYSYQGNGSANCSFMGIHKVLSDNSSMIFYSCGIGSGVNAYSISSAEYVKKLDKSYNVIFDTILQKPIFTNVEKDSSDNLYFGSSVTDSLQNISYYLQKMQSNGVITFDTVVDEFSDILFNNNRLYTINYKYKEIDIKEYDKLTGSYIQTITLPESRPIAHFQDVNNDLYYYFTQDEHIPNTFNSKSKLIIYKNFQKIQEVEYGINFEIYFQAVVDPLTKSIYFGSTQNGTSVHKIFNIDLNGNVFSKPVNNPSHAVIIENNSVYFSDANKLYQTDKNTLNNKKDITINFTSRFYNYKNFILHTNFSSPDIKILDEDLNTLATFILEKDFDFLHIDSDDRLHIHKTESMGYVLNSLPRWVIDNSQLYDLKQVSLSTNEIENESSLKISVYPNPTTGNINIELKDDLEKVDIYDINGKLVLKKTTNEFNIEKLSHGVYFLKITSKTNRTYFYKVIKK